MTNLFGFLYLLTVAGLSVYGLLGLLTLGLYWRHRQDTFPCPEVDEEKLPLVTVQLPVFNERYVVQRLIDSAVSLSYPRHKLQIQVLDDSTDDTAQKTADLAAYYKRKGLDIHWLHRTNRQGYKAGALAAGLEQATGEFIAVFDADFQPQPDFLRQTIPHFLGQPDLGMVQVRWGHLNGEESALTAVQAIALDKHFAIEQTVRHRANMFPKFNGSGGVWRRQCMEEAGGWQDDTVCEDLCLSTRAILRGWQFCFLNEVVAPAELPASLGAYKNQQARWAKGSLQCLQKFSGQILQNGRFSLTARLYAWLSMSAYATHLLVLALLLLQIPLIYIRYQFPPYLFIFSILGLTQPLLFVLAQKVLYPDWKWRLRHLPMLLLVAIGLAPSNSRAILQAVFGRFHPFVRTPKRGNQTSSYQLPFDWIVVVEVGCALYAAYGIGLALQTGDLGALFFLFTCLLGFGYVAGAGLHEQITAVLHKTKHPSKLKTAEKPR